MKKKLSIKLLSIIGISFLMACQPEDVQPNTTTDPANPSPSTNVSVTDQEGNVYSTIQIGSQTWMAENLRTTKFCNGDLISSNLDDEYMGDARDTSKWAHLDNDPQNESIYGKLYNAYSVLDNRGLCPCGWHVPTINEWNLLITFLGGQVVAGGKMKSSGTQLWVAPNHASNSSGFSALPGKWGGLSNPGNFFDWVPNGTQALFWSSSLLDMMSLHCIMLQYNSEVLLTDTGFGNMGMSVRCIKD